MGYISESELAFIEKGGRQWMRKYGISREDAGRVIERGDAEDIEGAMHDFCSDWGVSPSSPLARGELLRLLEIPE